MPDETTETSSATVGCVDASLVVRLLGADLAVLRVWERLAQSNGDLISPSLLNYEVANALHQQQRLGLVPAELAALQLDRCLRLPIGLHGDAQLHGRALEIAYERRLPVTYDAHYVALAERFRVPLWTCDRRLAAALGDGLLGDGLPEVHLVP
ncbi:MAG: type II toxin-antitoxin system VapC family toxin [Pseudonocardiaceae bacterium]